ncbi:MAG: hypothetical protein J6L86_04530 [Alphaproteobacteria bacterium]|nr:hypothetical protein [Alphaproteobacteria bacterium]
MADGRLVKIPATSEVFQYVVMKEIDAYSSLSSQEVYRYEDWLQMRNPVKARVHPLTEGLPYFPFVPDTMPVEKYEGELDNIYVLALPEIRQKLEVEYYTEASRRERFTLGRLHSEMEMCIAEAHFFRRCISILSSSEVPMRVKSILLSRVKPEVLVHVKSIYYVYEPTVKPKILKNSGEYSFNIESSQMLNLDVRLVEQHQFSRKIGNEEEEILIKISYY